MDQFVFLEKPTTFATAHSEQQRLTDCMCFLLYIIDLYLSDTLIILNFNENYLMKCSAGQFSDSNQNFIKH